LIIINDGGVLWFTCLILSRFLLLTIMLTDIEFNCCLFCAGYGEEDIWLSDNDHSDHNDFNVVSLDELVSGFVLFIFINKLYSSSTRLLSFGNLQDQMYKVFAQE